MMLIMEWYLLTERRCEGEIQIGTYASPERFYRASVWSQSLLQEYGGERDRI